MGPKPVADAMLLRMRGPYWPAPYMVAAALPMSLLRGGPSIGSAGDSVGEEPDSIF